MFFCIIAKDYLHICNSTDLVKLYWCRKMFHLENGSSVFSMQCNKKDRSIELKRKCIGFQEFLCFFEGAVSDWKNLFSEDQNEKMDKVFEERIAGTKLGKMLKYDLYCKA